MIECKKHKEIVAVEVKNMNQKLVYNLGDVVELKKQHPCGSKQWEIIRTGADFRLRCSLCKHQVMLSRVNFEKSVKRIVT